MIRETTGLYPRPRTRGDNCPDLRPRRKPVREPSASKAAPRCRDLLGTLADISRRLKVVGAIAITADVALRQQNCERDADIAACLRCGVVDALTTQIERMSRLCAPVAGDAP